MYIIVHKPYANAMYTQKNHSYINNEENEKYECFSSNFSKNIY